jgi:hypothetical protein
MIDTLTTVRELEAVGFEPTIAVAIAREFHKAGSVSLMDFNPIESVRALEASGLSHAKAMVIANVSLTIVKCRGARRATGAPNRR